jgi:acetyl-CoA carboxylase biotin carboxyl carrier protein
MKLNEIQDLIKFVSKSNVSEVELETKDFKIIIKTGKNTNNSNTTQPVIVQNVPSAIPATTIIPPATGLISPTGANASAIPATTIIPPAIAAVESPSASSTPQDNKVSEPKKDVSDEKNYHVVKSPMIGTFYRSPAPDKPPFVNIGDVVDVGQPLCIIEAMKLFNEIESDVKGKVVKILVENATPVEYDQPLFLIDTNI